MDVVELEARARERREALKDRHQPERDLQEALAELDYIREAIRRGLLSDLMRQMLDEAEGRVRDLQTGREPRAREAPGGILGQIVLRPSLRGYGRVPGKSQGLLTFGEPAPIWITVVAGARYARTVHLEPTEIAVS